MALPPVAGTIPALDPSWATGSLTPEEVRDQLRVLLGISLGHYELSRLSEAMAAVVSLSPVARDRIKADLGEWHALDQRIGEINAAEVDDGLPIIRADVVEYSEEPLRQGRSVASLRVQPLREQQERLALRVCNTLNPCLYSLDAAPCCPGHSALGVTRLRRS